MNWWIAAGAFGLAFMIWEPPFDATPTRVRLVELVLIAAAALMLGHGAA